MKEQMTAFLIILLLSPYFQALYSGEIAEPSGGVKEATNIPIWSSPSELPHRPVLPAEWVDVDGIRVTTTESFEVSHNPSEYLERYNISHIEQLARSLDYNPSLIYYYVKNNMDYEPYFGPMAGPEWTLLQGGGNSFDQAGLLVALLRQSGVPARYVYGWVEIPAENASEWLRVKNVTLAVNLWDRASVPVAIGVDPSGEIVYVYLVHAWAEAYLPYQDFRGQIRSESGYAWIPLDPSFKTYEYVEGMESPINSTYASDFVNNTLSASQYDETEGWITGINKTSVMDEVGAYSNKTLEDVISDPELSNLTFMQLFGSWQLNKEHSEFLPSKLPYDVYSVVGVFSEFPQDLHHKITFKIIGNIWGQPVIFLSYTALSTEIAGKRVTISFIPATDHDAAIIEEAGGILHLLPGDVDMKPVLTIAGKHVAEGPASSLATQLELIIEYTHDYLYSHTRRSVLTVGAYYAIVSPVGKVPSRLLEEETANLVMTSYLLSSDGDFTMDEAALRDETIGQLLYLTGLEYFYLLDLLTDVQSLPNHIRWCRWAPFQAIVSWELSVHYWGDIPTVFKAAGINVDVLTDTIELVGEDDAKEMAFMLSFGMTGSALEHLTLELLYGVPSVSTMKILEEANDRGIRIYMINQTNLNEVLPILQLQPDVKDDIESDVEAGRIVWVPEQEIQIKDWKGTGWASINPDTGGGGYFISGGLGSLVRGGAQAEVPDWAKLIGGRVLDLVACFVTPLSIITLLYAMIMMPYTLFSLWESGKVDTAIEGAMFGACISFMLIYFAVTIISIMFVVGPMSYVGWEAAVIYGLFALLFGWLADGLIRVMESGVFSSDHVTEAKSGGSFAHDLSLPAIFGQSSASARAQIGVQWLLDNQNPDGGWGFSREISSGFLRDTVLAGQIVVSEKATSWVLSQQEADGGWGSVDHTARAIIYLDDRGYDTSNAVSWLVANQNPDGGWGLFRGYGSDAWETALVLRALASKPGYDLQRTNATDWLLLHQNPDGGWGINASDTYITSVTVISLISAGYDPNSTELQAALAWLENQTWSCTSEISMMLLSFSEASYESEVIDLGLEWLLDNQNPDGGWGSSKNHTSTPYHTPLAVRALEEYSQTDPATEGRNWLTNAQSPEGYWGYISEVKHTSFATITLSEQGYIFSNATDWLLSHQNPDGSWGSLESTCYAVWALSQAGIINSKGIDFILASQNPDGGWGGHTNTSLAIISLSYSGVEISNDTITWLLNARNPDWGWGAPKSETFDTSLALKALTLVGVQNEKGVTWLKVHQGLDSGWTYVDSTALALDILLETDFNCTSAIQWLLDRQNLDEGWGLDRSQSCTTATVVHALWKAGYKPEPDITEPVISSITRDPTTPNYKQSVTVTAEISDPSGISSATLKCSDGTGWTDITMTHVGGNQYSGTIPAKSYGTTVRYYIVAVDNSDNTATSEEHTYTVGDDIDPTGEITDPLIGSFVSQTLDVTVEGYDDNFDNMELYINGDLRHTWTTSGTQTYTLDTRTLADGTHTLKLIIQDKAGNLLEKAITVTVDNTEPTVSITAVDPSDPDTTQTVTFTVVVNDNTVGSGIANVTLYVDGSQVQTWTTDGTHNYTGGPYSEGTHTYYAQAFDKANNERRDPTTGNKEFTVSAQPPPQPIPLWQIIAMILTVAAVTAIIALITRRKRSVKVTSAKTQAVEYCKRALTTWLWSSATKPEASI